MLQKEIQHIINVTGYETYAEYIKKAAQIALNTENVQYKCEINVEITDNHNIQKLNKKFRDKDNPTDVLSFPMIDSDKIKKIKKISAVKSKKIFADEINPGNGAILLGDIVISIEKAKEQSIEINQSLERELMFLCVHSVLHLLGCDHEISEEQDLIMRKKQREIMDFIEKNTENNGNNMGDNINNINKKTAFVAIVGRPNVGKSTLLNALLNEKVSIISKKPQTTRNKITGILTQERLIDGMTSKVQYVFFDTPGIHLPKSLLGRYMAKSAKSAISDVDAVVLMIEPVARISPVEREVMEKTKSGKIPVILAINKIDTIQKAQILEVIQVYSQEYEFAAILPISAMTGDGVELVMDEINKYLVDIEPDGELFFPEDMLTDQPERQIASEIIREKTLRLLTDEVPHGIGVSIEEFKAGEKLISIRAEIFCEKETHKRIIIGKHGEMIKKIGTYAREDLEKFFETKIYLDLWVKVKKDWRDKPSILSNLGYNERDL